ncbi:Uncharacterized protein M6B38_222290 [Iris pallida]|nr:Uncharacterized protein M6B38_222290 [Iris pallida]
MESAAILRSLNGALQSVTPAKSFFEKHAVAPSCRDASKRSLLFHIPLQCKRITCSSASRKGPLLSHVKASETTSAMTSDAGTAESIPQGLLQKKSTFPNGFETLVLDVCDETDVTELKLKVGDFEMHIKRDIGTPKSAPPVAPAITSSATASPATPPPASSKPSVESGPSAKTAPPKSTTAATSPFANVSSAKTSKLAALEASGSNTYVIISSPTVGLFRSGRTVKGKKQPPSCKEGDMIKEGQIIGFLDQFGSELPVRADVAGEALKILFKDGEAVGYGDPLVAVLPSFHGIK